MKPYNKIIFDNTFLTEDFIKCNLLKYIFNYYTSFQVGNIIDFLNIASYRDYSYTYIDNEQQLVNHIYLIYDKAIFQIPIIKITKDDTRYPNESYFFGDRNSFTDIDVKELDGHDAQYSLLSTLDPYSVWGLLYELYDKLKKLPTHALVYTYHIKHLDTKPLGPIRLAMESQNKEEMNISGYSEQEQKNIISKMNRIKSIEGFFNEGLKYLVSRPECFERHLTFYNLAKKALKKLIETNLEYQDMSFKSKYSEYKLMENEKQVEFAIKEINNRLNRHINHNFETED